MNGLYLSLVELCHQMDAAIPLESDDSDGLKMFQGLLNAYTGEVGPGIDYGLSNEVIKESTEHYVKKNFAQGTGAVFEGSCVDSRA